jgi:hypothetical protein
MPRDDAERRSMQCDENLDVVRTSRDHENLQPKGCAGESAPDPHLSVVCPFPAQPPKQRQRRGNYRTHKSKYISVPQATNIVEAVKFAKLIGLPLVAHLTIHWSGTVAFDDPDGTRFAKVRECLAKVLLRRGIPTAWVWCLECKAHTDIVHSHLLFHVPTEYRFGRKLDELQAAVERLAARHAAGIWSEYAVKIKIWCDPDGLYLLKGGGPKVWKRFRIKKKFREAQGIIQGKRCGVSESLGPSARLRHLMTQRKPVDRKVTRMACKHFVQLKETMVGARNFCMGNLLRYNKRGACFASSSCSLFS